MGKRRRAPAVPQKAVWDHNSQIALLGLLDFCIKHKHAFPFKQDFVAGRLYPTEPTELPPKPYSWEQIIRKLYSLWGKYGKDDSPNKEEILKKGSICFAERAITVDQRAFIQTELERLEEELKPLGPSKLRESPRTREATGVSSFTIESFNSLENYTSDENIKCTSSQTPRSQRYQTRELSILSRKRTETPNYISLEDQTPKKQPRHTKKISQNSYKKQRFHSTEKILNPEEHRLGELSKNDEFGTTPELGQHRAKDENWVNTSFYEYDEASPLRPSSRIQEPQEEPGPSPASLERMKKAALRKREEKITELEQIITSHEEKAIELRNKIDSFRAMQNGDAQKIVFHLTQEVQSLRMAKEEYLRLGKFAALKGNYGAARKEMNMEVQVAGIRHHIKNIVGGFDDDIILQYPGSSPTAGLRGLLSFGFGLDGNIPLENDKFESLLSKHTSYSIIETLMEAAVCTWVLETSFPDFVKPSGSLDLGATYRKLLASQGDYTALRSLDLAAHYDLINTPRFQKLLNGEAENLASSLSKTLSTFFPRDAEESENNLFETWSEDELTWKERRGRMVDMFKDSLTMKSNSLLTPERYELITYPPGSLFDPSRMEVDGGNVDVLAGGGSKVRHCLHVAIQAIAKDPVKDGASVEEATVQSKNFTRIDGRQNSGATAATILVKAVIVFEGPQENEEP